MFGAIITGAARRSRLHDLLWPCPQAWAGLAAVWVVILIMNFPGGKTEVARSKPVPSSPEVLMALREHRRLLVELIESPMPVEPPRTFVPRRRSERPSEHVAV